MGYSSDNIRPRRSLLFVPAINPTLIPKAVAVRPDVICLDLEDAIAADQKDEAREHAMAFMASADRDTQIEWVIRINNPRTKDGLRDVLAVCEAAHPPPSILIPKIKSAEEVQLLDETLVDTAEAVRFHAIIETNEALDDAVAIARASDRLDSISFGGVDLAAELRTTVDWEPMLYARSRLVHAAAGAGIDLLDVPELNLDDMAGLERDAKASMALGYTGKCAIHPKQVEAINRVFTPSEEQVAFARKAISAFEQSESSLVVVDGRLIEKPVMRSLRRVVAVADRVSQE